MKKQFTEEEIREKLDAIRVSWLKEEKDESKKAEQKKMLVCENLKWLKLYRKQYPDGYEKYYWDNYRILEQDNVWRDAYANIIQTIGLIIATVGIVIAAISTFLDQKIIFFDNFQVKLIYISMMVVLLIGVILTIPYLRSCFNTREHSYYRIFVSMLDDLRKNEEAFDETEKEAVCGEANINDAKANDRTQAVEKKKEEISSEPCKKEAVSEKSKAEKKKETPCTVQNAERN